MTEAVTMPQRLLRAVDMTITGISRRIRTGLLAFPVEITKARIRAKSRTI